MNCGRWAALSGTAVCILSWVALGAAALGPAGLAGIGSAVYVLGVVPLGLGWLLVLRAPGNVVGPVLTWLAASTLATPAVEAWGETASTESPWWGSSVVHVLGAGTWPWQLVGFMAVLLVFPDGLLPGRRWTAAAIAVPGSALLVNAAFVLTMNYHDAPPAHSPIAVPRAVWGFVIAGALLILLAVVIVCMAAVVVRYRSGDDRVRQQLRWLILAAVIIVTLMVASWVVTSLGWLGNEAYGGFLLGIVVLVPAAVTIAVLRHDLFEIDRILSDSVAWVLTTAVAALALALIAGSIDYLIGRDSQAGIMGSVFLVALAVLPLHRAIHRAVARVIDRDRAVILERVQRFVEQVRDGSAEPESVEQVLRAAVGDPRLCLLLTDLNGNGFVDLDGRPSKPAENGVPLRSADTEIGMIVVSPGSMRRLRRARLAGSAARLPIEVSRLRLGARGRRQPPPARHRHCSGTTEAGTRSARRRPAAVACPGHAAARRPTTSAWRASGQR